MDRLPEILAALAFFGLVVICPIVMMFLRHQRQMAELIHGRHSSDTVQRLEALERELRELKALKHQQAIIEDDQRELQNRIP